MIWPPSSKSGKGGERSADDPRRLEVLETAPDNPARSSAPVKLSSGRFSFAREHISVQRAESLDVMVPPNRKGRALVAHYGQRVRLTLRVTYTPAGGRPRTMRLNGFRLPSCSDPDNDGDCD